MNWNNLTLLPAHRYVLLHDHVIEVSYWQAKAIRSVFRSVLNVLGVYSKDMKRGQYGVCIQVVWLLYSSWLRELSTKVIREGIEAKARIDIDAMPNEAKGKVRHVGAWAIYCWTITEITCRDINLSRPQEQILTFRSESAIFW